MWTYDPSQIATNEMYAIRAEIQDTDPRDQQLADEEIIWAASQERNFWGAAARCLEMISRAKLRKADVKLGRAMMITYTRMAMQLADEAKKLRLKASSVPWVGGMSVTDKLNYATDSDLLQPLFTKTMMENQWAGEYNTDSLPPVGGGRSNVDTGNV